MCVRRHGGTIRSTSFVAVIACLTLACGSSDSPSAVITPPPPEVVTPASLAVGASTTLAVGSQLPLAGGSSGGEFVLIVADTAADGSSASAAFQITATGIATAGAVSPPSTSTSPVPDAVSTSVPRLDYTFAARLNERARPRLAAQVANARRAFSDGTGTGGRLSASRSGAPLQLGDLITLNVSSRACDSLLNRVSRVAAI